MSEKRSSRKFRRQEGIREPGLFRVLRNSKAVWVQKSQGRMQIPVLRAVR
jgi:hypothetical protein